MGSVSPIRPSSTSMRAATEVIGFVMEAILKIVSRSTGQIGFDIPPAHTGGLDLVIAPDQSGRPGELSRVDDRLQCRFDFVSSIHFSRLHLLIFKL